MDTPEGFNIEKGAAMKQSVVVPVIAVGRIHDPRIADEAIGRGDVVL